MTTLLAMLLAALLAQAQAAPATPAAPGRVIVGLADGQQLLLESPVFKGFIEQNDAGEWVLFYRQEHFHGEMRLDTIARIELGYRRGEPYPLAVTMADGETVEVRSDHRSYLIVEGATDTGSVTVRHPDPIQAPLRLTTSAPNREDALTIRYLEFPR